MAHLPKRDVRAGTLSAVSFLLLVCGQSVFGAYETVIDPVSGRRGHVSTSVGSGFGLRRRLASGCSSFTACPSATDAAKIILGNNPNLTISNATFTKGTCTSTMAQWGIVPGSGWAAGHPMKAWFPNGSLILSSGDASAANCGVNSLDYYTLLVGGGGDANLNSLIPAFTTYDAVALEFTVTALKNGLLVFKYAFGSDEYTEWVGTAFNDVFGFFIAPIAQPISTGHNVAIVKGTADTQVSINNVNHNSHQEIYNNNRIGAVSPLKSIEADGFTNLLNTQGFQVAANQQYRFKLAIADAGDRILDSWVWLGGDSLIIDTQPVANGTVDDPLPNCSNKVVTLNANSSYDPDKDDVLTYTWTISAACYPTVTQTGTVVQLDLSTLAANVTYTVTLVVSDDSDVEDRRTWNLFVPPACGANIPKSCGASPPPPPSYTPPVPPGAKSPPPPPPAPQSPPPPPPPYLGDYVMVGDVGIVPCGSPGVTFDVSMADDDMIAQIDKSMDFAPYDLYYHWNVYDMEDDSVPIVSQTTMGPDGTIISFTADDLKQGRSLKKFKLLVDVTNADTWDQGDGGILAVETFVQVLQCPIEPSWPLPTVVFDAPESFTLSCGTTVLLNGSAALAAATLKYSKTATKQVLRWSLLDDDEKVIWTLDSPPPTTTLHGTGLVAAGVITPGAFYTLRLVVLLDSKDFDSDSWETKMSVQACAPGSYPSPPPPPPAAKPPSPSPPSPPPPVKPPPPPPVKPPPPPPVKPPPPPPVKPPPPPPAKPPPPPVKPPPPPAKPPSPPPVKPPPPPPSPPPSPPPPVKTPPPVATSPPPVIKSPPPVVQSPPPAVKSPPPAVKSPPPTKLSPPATSSAKPSPPPLKPPPKKKSPSPPPESPDSPDAPEKDRRR